MKFCVRTLLWLVLMLAAAGCSVSAQAATSAPAATTGNDMVLNGQQSFKQSVVAVIGAMHVAGAKLAPLLVPTGKKLLAVFFALTAGWNIFQGILSGQMDQVIRTLINQILVTLIALEILLGWTDTAGVGVAGFLTVGMEQLSQPFGAGSGPTDQMVDNYWNAIVDLLEVIPQMWDHGSWLSRAKFVAQLSVQGIVVPELFAWGMVLLYVVLVVWVVLICAGTLVVAMLYSLLFINMGDFIIYIALAVGPVFVATLAFPPANHYFSKWLEFAISGGIYKLIAVVLSALMLPVFNIIYQYAGNVVGLDSGWLWEIGKNILGFIVYGIIMLFWSFMAYSLSKQIPTFSHALASGMSLHIQSLSAMKPDVVQSMEAHGRKHLEGKLAGAGGGMATGATSNRALRAMAAANPELAPITGTIQALRSIRDKAARKTRSTSQTDNPGNEEDV